MPLRRDRSARGGGEDNRKSTRNENGNVNENENAHASPHANEATGKVGDHGDGQEIGEGEAVEGKHGGSSNTLYTQLLCHPPLKPQLEPLLPELRHDPPSSPKGVFIGVEDIVASFAGRGCGVQLLHRCPSAEDEGYHVSVFEITPPAW